MKKQYEQYCNAAMLKSMGVHVMKKLSKNNLPVIEDWLASTNTVDVNYPDNAQQIADTIVKQHATSSFISTDFESENYSIFQ
jgi:hypothetical protein